MQKFSQAGGLIYTTWVAGAVRGWLLTIGTVMFLASSVAAMPSDYQDEATDKVSAEELNLLYGSIPHKPGEDRFIVHGTHRVSNVLKYYVISKPDEDSGQKYLIVDTSGKGCAIYYEGDEHPFIDGMAPILQESMPMEALWGLYSDTEAGESEVARGDSQSKEAEEIINQIAHMEGGSFADEAENTPEE